MLYQAVHNGLRILLHLEEAAHFLHTRLLLTGKPADQGYIRRLRSLSQFLEVEPQRIPHSLIAHSHGRHELQADDLSTGHHDLYVQADAPGGKMWEVYIKKRGQFPGGVHFGLKMPHLSRPLQVQAELRLHPLLAQVGQCQAHAVLAARGKDQLALSASKQ